MKKSTQKKMAKMITSLILDRPKKEKKKPKPEAKETKTRFNVTVKSEYVESDPKEHETFIPDRMEIEGFNCPGGGFCSWAEYMVEGKDEETGKDVNRCVCASCESEAMRISGTKGITDPATAKVIPHDMPTERQLEYARDLNIMIPEGINKRDISAIITRAEEWDDYISIPIYTTKLPTIDFARYAIRRNCLFSMYDCEPEVVACALCDSDKKFAIAFYAYRLICVKKGTPIMDMESDIDYSKYMAFADRVLSDEALEKSFDNNKYDVGNGHIKVYKEFQNFFECK